MADRLRVLNNYAHHAAARPERNLYPVAAQAGLRGQVHGDGGHAVPGRISERKNMCHTILPVSLK